MCGIAGVLYSDPDRPVDPDVLSRMATTIAHRGPDAEGFWINGPVGLAHRRLSIIDLSGGDQPMSNEDGSVQVVFNGEIYNYQTLRQELEANGHVFRTCSDTEVLAHLYEQHGDRMVDRLRGMFAFAIWDHRNRCLFLARDRVGIKPLYVSVTSERVVFGSELKAVLAHGDVSKELSPEALDEYLHYGMVPGSRCIYRGVEKLLPGHSLTVTLRPWQLLRRHYWQLEWSEDSSLSLQDWKTVLLDKLRETVRLHLVSDVPVGSFLSGGIDSSVVTGLASQALPVPLRTFSLGFQEARFNELPAAREIAAHFGTEHTDELVTPDAATLLPELARYYDEPFADSSAIPTYLVSRLAARHVKVVLSGDGGDEALGGYARYQHDLKEASLRSLVPGFLRSSVLRAMAALWPKADWLPRPLRLKTLLTNLSLPADQAYANTLSLCRQPLRLRLLHPDLRSAVSRSGARDIAVNGFRQAPASDPLAGMISADMATLLPDDYLVKVDRASMACGLEVRTPLLDHEFLELCAGIPSRWKIHDGETKWLMRETAKSLLPVNILKRPKQGFEIPVDAWLRGPLQGLFQDLVLAPGASVSTLIDQSCARRLMARHRTGQGRHGSTLWSLLALAVWAERSQSSVTEGTGSSQVRRPTLAGTGGRAW